MTFSKIAFFGIEINAEAARVAAFSLYLALLDQQEPPDIASGGPLPYLLHSGLRDEKHFGILIVSDAFALTKDERELLSKRVAAKKAYKGRAGDVRLLANAGILDLPLGGFDVVIGNPPGRKRRPSLVAGRLRSNFRRAKEPTPSFSFIVL